MKKLLAFVLGLSTLLAPVTVCAFDEDGEIKCMTLEDEDGQMLARYGGEMGMEDEYISSDNRRFRISALDLDGCHCTAGFVENVTLPEPNLPAAKQDWTPVVCIYCTHSDESYVPDSGTESEAEGGDILEVAEAFAARLKKLGCEVVLDESLHGPHDRDAYTRSRETASQLIRQENPTLLVDLHRDGAPEDEYTFQINGEDATHVRIVLGRKNKNFEDNESFAHRIKAVADKLYPGLVKDIFLGKGQYNQDLMSRSLLLEIGTHESDKQAALNSANYAAQVVASTLGASGSVPTPSASAAPKSTPSPKSQSQSPSPQSNGGSNAAGAVAAVLLILALVAGILTLIFWKKDREA